jgi:acetoacetyl-CoA synthetase
LPFRNPGGVRFGSAEIYDVVESCFSGSAALKPAYQIIDCVAVGQTIDGGKDERVILFVKLVEGESLSPELERKIKEEIRVRRSARHVPACVSGGSLQQYFLTACVDRPSVGYTIHVERKTCRGPGKEGCDDQYLLFQILNVHYQIINGGLLSVNPATLRNPEVLEEYVRIGEALRGAQIKIESV